jgi:O-antigen ligase
MNLMNIFAILFGILYFFLAIRRLDWAVMFLLAALPTYLIRFKVFGIPFTVLEAMILIAFIVWVLFYTKFYSFIRGKYSWQKFKENKKKRIKYPFRWEIILLLLISYWAVVVAGFSDSALGIWKAYFFEPVLVFILILNLFKREDKIKMVLWPLVLSVLAVSLLAIYQKLTGTLILNELWAAEETRRVTSFFGYPNAVGLYLGPLILVMIGWLLYNVKCKMQNAKLFFIFITIILSLLSIYFAKSEGALIAVAAGLFIFGLLASKRVRLATITLVVVVGFVVMAYQPVREYAINKITLHDLSGEIRKQQWRETWQMMTASPGQFIFGTGLSNYQKAILPYHQEGIFFNKDNDPEFHRHVVWNEEYKKMHWQPVEIYMYPHNILLNFWTELGLAGMLLFVWIIGKYFVIAIKNLKLEIKNLDNEKRKYLVLGLMGVMIVIIVHGIVDVPYFKNDLAVMFWVFIALASIINLEARKKKEEVKS